MLKQKLQIWTTIRKMIGNKNEIVETIDSLNGNGEKYFMELIYSSCITMLLQAKLVIDETNAKQMIDDAIFSKKALNKFLEMVEYQGGDSKIILEKEWWNPKYKYEIKAEKEGYVYINNSIELGLAAMKLGAGRKFKEDTIDNDAGIQLNKVTNEFVKINETIITLYSSKEIPNELVENVKKVISINNKLKPIKTILKIID